MSITKKYFGTLASGEDVSLYILEAGDCRATFIDYGATWTTMFTPDRSGNRQDILLGFATLAGYAGKHPFFGSTVGRFANRIANARFMLNGREYPLWANNGRNHLHGGRRGFDKHMWKAEAGAMQGNPSVIFHRISPDGEEGYPGTLDIQVQFTLDASGALEISYKARTDAPTPVNLTNHAYFNLAGEGAGTILKHELEMACSFYLPVTEDLIPEGLPRHVDGTPFDFRTRKSIGRDIASAGGGYDHCFVIDKKALMPDNFAHVWEPTSGRTLSVATTMPAVQFYTGNNLNGITGKRGSLYERYAGFCLETEFYPDSPNRPEFPSAILHPDSTWEQRTVYAFGVET